MGVFTRPRRGYPAHFTDGYWLSTYREIMHILDALLAFCAYFFIGAAMV
ncbi:DUF350 domain-containing protein, partial [Salmonella enterica subsp. enterica serovar Typhimurium]|nr:DUF350 domain-containing protein [Salmonella enterica subsp. enterica serovar Typhimurium]